jgi:hypothetical protein
MLAGPREHSQQCDHANQQREKRQKKVIRKLGAAAQNIVPIRLLQCAQEHLSPRQRIRFRNRGHEWPSNLRI